MLPRTRDGINRRRPTTNIVLLEEIQSLRTRMAKMGTAQRRTPDKGVSRAAEESSEEE